MIVKYIFYLFGYKRKYFKDRKNRLFHSEYDKYNYYNVSIHMQVYSFVHSMEETKPLKSQCLF